VGVGYDFGMPAGGQVMIRLERVSKVWPGAATPAVSELSLDIKAGEVVCLVGPSGCGKTTTLKMINRIIEPTSGRIEVDGQDVRAMERHVLRRRIGYVIQQVGLFPHRTIAANIATVPKLLGWDRERIAARTSELIGSVGLLAEMLGRYPSELSGGQQQRVGVARALAADPPVLLMDEPFGAVDPIVRTRLQDELAALQGELRKTIVFVTHDIDEAFKLGDRVVVMNVGGVIEQAASPLELLARPANAFVERFIGTERGLKRLALVRVRDMPLQRGPVVDATTSAAEAEAVARRHRVDWVGVLDGDVLRGWVSLDDLDRAAPVGTVPTRRFSAWAGPDGSLREALDAVVRSGTRVAVVLDANERYLGMLTIDEIAERLPG
jgi:osmoprotectant transport system ATP-binding protein